MKISPGGLVMGIVPLALVIGSILLIEHYLSARSDARRARQAAQQLSEGDNLAAIHAFARLAAERPSDISAVYNLGAAYHNYGWHAEALAAYEEVLELANEYAARAAHSAARVALLRKEFERAREYYETALRHRPAAEDIRQEYEQFKALWRANGPRP
ncbi:MAG: hypothetical protein HYV36_08940 [Lentisphaerae bacterium]|nr:hypothetical protein [Lentisphaerota bacterium]